MKHNREYIYSVPNTSCTIRVVQHLRHKYRSLVDSIVVINLIDRWLIQVSLKSSISERAHLNLQAFLEEMGVIARPAPKIMAALNSLKIGTSPTEVMNRHQVVIVVYGKPETEEIEIFRDRIVDRLGYCPQNMA